MVLPSTRLSGAFMVGANLLLGAAASSTALAQSCTDNTSPTVSCSDLRITGTNIVIEIPTGIVLSGGDAIGVQSGATGLELTIQTGAIVGQYSVYGIRSYGGAISSITNLGQVIGDFNRGLYNGGTLGVLNNLQGATGALNYRGPLPTNYNIIIGSSVNYGKLAANLSSDNTIFGISALSAGASVVSGTAYTSVLTGISEVRLGLNAGDLSLSGTSNNYGYTLTQTSLGSNVWDLLVTSFYIAPTGPSLANTQASVDVTGHTLQNTYAHQNAELTNSFSYDCAAFNGKNMCFSAGGRNATVQGTYGPNNLGGFLVAAHQVQPNYRVGAYLDQSATLRTQGSTVSLGNKTPLIGLFGVWSERPDGTGGEVKVSAAYGQKNASISRAAFGSGAAASEAGTGGSSLNSQGAQLMAKHGFGVGENVIVSPYAAIRHTRNSMGGYTEASSSAVTNPLAYGALKTTATTALAGLGASYRFARQAMAFASAGLESDVSTSNGTYSATGVTGLTPVNFNNNPVKRRATVSLGAYYDVAKNQRIGVMGIYRQEPYRAVSTKVVMASYTVGL